MLPCHQETPFGSGTELLHRGQQTPTLTVPAGTPVGSGTSVAGGRHGPAPRPASIPTFACRGIRDTRVNGGSFPFRTEGGTKIQRRGLGEVTAQGERGHPSVLPQIPGPAREADRWPSGGLGVSHAPHSTPAHSPSPKAAPPPGLCTGRRNDPPCSLGTKGTRFLALSTPCSPGQHEVCPRATTDHHRRRGDCLRCAH